METQREQACSTSCWQDGPAPGEAYEVETIGWKEDTTVSVTTYHPESIFLQLFSTKHVDQVSEDLCNLWFRYEHPRAVLGKQGREAEAMLRGEYQRTRWERVVELTAMTAPVPLKVSASRQIPAT